MPFAVRTVTPTLIAGVLVLGLLASACGPIPGGSLPGTVRPAPSDWSAEVADKRFCEIESRPADPHSIQLECFRFGGGLYVNRGYDPPPDGIVVFRFVPRG